MVSNALRLKLFKPKFHKNQQLKATEAVVETHTIIETTEEKGETAMKKTMMIEGMMCAHCSGRVEKALNAIDGVTAKVDLEAKPPTSNFQRGERRDPEKRRHRSGL